RRAFNKSATATRRRYSNEALRQKRRGREKNPGLTCKRFMNARLVREDHLQLFHDLFFRMSLGDRQFLDEQGSRRVEHLALAERQLLVALEDEQIAQHLCNFQRRTSVDFFRVFAIPAV